MESKTFTDVREDSIEKQSILYARWSSIYLIKLFLAQNWNSIYNYNFKCFQVTEKNFGEIDLRIIDQNIKNLL